MAKSTFNADFKITKGIQNLFNQYASEANTTVHFLSGSPWQLYQPFSIFFSQQGLPQGIYHLFELNTKLISGNLFTYILGDKDSILKERKKAYIKYLATKFPRKEFVLFGDSSQYDPEVYAWAAQNFPDQIKQIYIRNVTSEPRSSIRFRIAYGNHIGKLNIIDPETGAIERNPASH